MGKFILFSLNLIFLSAYHFFFGGEVAIDQQLPAQVNAGEKFTVEIQITKGEREGFAKWQQELPDGFIATSGETAGATFSFKKNTVKLIWMALPDEDQFTISYVLETSPTLSGSFDLNGKFSYIENNERKDITSELKTIKVGDAPLLADKAEEEQKEATEEAPAEADASEMTASEETSSPEEPITEKEEKTPEELIETSGDLLASGTVTSNDDITIRRSIQAISKGKYEVNLTIDKKDFSSFGKVEEYIPNGYVAKEKESMQGMFSFNNKVMKILWMALPKEEQIKVSYTLESTSDELDSATVHGVFSFLKGEESVQLAMKGNKFPNTFEAAPDQEQLAMKEEVEEDAEEAKEEETSMVEEKPKQEASKSLADKKEELSKEITSVPSPETSVSYRVQIAAGKKEVGQDYFVKRHGIRENVVIDYHKSWYKYMIGSYGIYKEARDRRNDVWAADNKIKDAFVTAYNAGERISVQEALMITKQKWYK